MADGYTITLKLDTEELTSGLATAEKELTDFAEKSGAEMSPNDLIEQFKKLEEAMNKVVTNTGLIGQNSVQFIENLDEYLQDNPYLAYLDSINGKIASVPDTVDDASRRIKKSTKEVSKSASKSGSDILAVFKGFASKFLKLFGFATIIALIRKAFMKIGGIVADGFEKMAKRFSDSKKTLNDFKNALATMNNALVGAFEPIVNTVIPYLTRFIDMLTSCIDKFAQFIALISGRSTYKRAIKQTKDYTNALSDAGKALAKFDDLDVLNQGNGDGALWEEAEISQGLKDALAELPELLSKFDEYWQSFKDGFEGAFTFKGGEVKENAKKIAKSIEKIFSDPEVQSAFDRALNKLTNNSGAISGDALTIGQNIAINITGGFANYLENGGEDKLAGYLVKALDEIGRSSDILASVSHLGATLSEAVGSETGQQFTSAFISAVNTVTGESLTNGLTIGNDIVTAMTQPLTDNEGGFETALEGFLGTGATTLEGLDNTVLHISDSFMLMWERVNFALSKLSESWSKATKDIVDGWNEDVQPTLDRMAQYFNELMEGDLAPFFDDLFYFIGEVSVALEPILSLLTRIIGFIGKYVLPVVLECVSNITRWVLNLSTGIIKTFGGLFRFFGGWFEAIGGLITGNYEQVVNGTESMIQGLYDMFTGLFRGVLRGAQTVLESAIGWINKIIDGLNVVRSITGEKALDHISTDFNLGNLISEDVDISAMKAGTTTALQNMKDFFLHGNTFDESPYTQDINKALENITTGNSQSITIELDGQTLARAELPYLNAENNRIGTNLAMS